jgi:very-short-patch-repair endonuclease
MALLSFDHALDLYAYATSRRVLAHSTLRAAVAEHFGCAGNAQLLRLLTFTRRGALSVAENRLHSILDVAGLTGWQANVAIQDRAGAVGVVDLLFVKQRVIVEIDGRRAHSSSEAFINDRRRQNRLVNAGFTVVRFTWDDLVNRPDKVIDQIRQALRMASP